MLRRILNDRDGMYSQRGYGLRDRWDDRRQNGALGIRGGDIRGYPRRQRVGLVSGAIGAVIDRSTRGSGGGRFESDREYQEYQDYQEYRRFQNQQQQMQGRQQDGYPQGLQSNIDIPHNANRRSVGRDSPAGQSRQGAYSGTRQDQTGPPEYSARPPDYYAGPQDPYARPSGYDSNPRAQNSQQSLEQRTSPGADQWQGKGAEAAYEARDSKR